LLNILLGNYSILNKASSLFDHIFESEVRIVSSTSLFTSSFDFKIVKIGSLSILTAVLFARFLFCFTAVSGLEQL